MGEEMNGWIEGEMDGNVTMNGCWCGWEIGTSPSGRMGFSFVL